MRKWNTILTAAILALFLLHGIFGAFQLFGVGSTALKAAAWTALALVAAHTVIGVKLTADSLRVWKQTGVGYFRQNKLFWARQISGKRMLVSEAARGEGGRLWTRRSGTGDCPICARN